MDLHIFIINIGNNGIEDHLYVHQPISKILPTYTQGTPGGEHDYTQLSSIVHLEYQEEYENSWK